MLTAFNWTPEKTKTIYDDPNVANSLNKKRKILYVCYSLVSLAIENKYKPNTHERK